MDQRRQLLTFVLMLGIFLVWMNVAPLIFPQYFGPAKPQPKPVATNLQTPTPPAAAPGTNAGDTPAEAPAADAPADEPAPQEIARFPERTVVLGDADKGFLQRLELSTFGATIRTQQLTESQYRTLDRSEQVRLLGNNPETSLRTLGLRSGSFDALLGKEGLTLATVHWEFLEGESEAIPGTDAFRKAVFRYPSPDGKWEARKTFSLEPVDAANSNYDARGYLIDAVLTFRNLTAEPQSISYQLQGPVGLPLENAENTQIFRQAEAGTLEDAADPTDVSHVSLTASAMVKQINEAIADDNPGRRPMWRYPVRWAGIDMQFFAALLIPGENQLADRDADGKPDPYFAEIHPIVVTETTPVERSDISLVFHSNPLSVPAMGQAEHKLQLYLGPKRADLLASFQADSVMNFGWFGVVSKLMVSLLNFFHHTVHLPYWIAIILLTVMVRGGMFPLSRRQVASLQKMKEINPKLQEIRTKYADDKEALTRAQLELMRKHGYNPFAGCLPIIIQLPIFIGLYNGLNTAIDLRPAQFLWADSLAAPDALFGLPFRVPVLGWTQFNLFPLLTIVLFIVQNKLFTPPATTDEQALQYKMMNVMMVVIGVMFYRVPAGLCVYFIASSLWGICERKLLDRHKLALEAAGAAAAAAVKETSSESEPPREPGFLQKLLEAADQAKNPTNGKSRNVSANRGSSKKSNPRR